MSRNRPIGDFLSGLMFSCALVGCGARSDTPTAVGSSDTYWISQLAAAPSDVGLDSTSELAAPVRLEANGRPIDIGQLSSIAHAGPWIADVDNDGDRDLLVGDFPGYFWLFDNVGSESKPQYTSKGKLQAGGVDAKTPVY